MLEVIPIVDVFLIDPSRNGAQLHRPSLRASNPPFQIKDSLVDPRLRASNEHSEKVPPSLPTFSPKRAGCLISHCAQLPHPPPNGTPRRAMSPCEGLPIFPTCPMGSSRTILHCAHRTSTVSSCAFCEQEGWSGCSPLSSIRTTSSPLP